jgi:hypothetical protein
MSWPTTGPATSLSPRLLSAKGSAAGRRANLCPGARLRDAYRRVLRGASGPLSRPSNAFVYQNITLRKDSQEARVGNEGAWRLRGYLLACGWLP